MDWLGFALAVLLVELTPGPNMAWLASLSVAQGRRAGVAATAGVALGLAINATVAAAGLAAIATSSPLVWNLLRYAGTALMLWLAWEGWRDAGESSPPRGKRDGTDGQNFRAGLATNILNPKAFLFYAAVLPQFLPAHDRWGAAAILALIAVMLATSIHLLIVAASSIAGRWLDDPKTLKLARRILALSLVLVAAWLFYSSAPA